MAHQEQKITVKELMYELSLIIRDELIAMYTEEEAALQIHFLNGQHFRVRVEEFFKAD